MGELAVRSRLVTIEKRDSSPVVIEVNYRI